MKPLVVNALELLRKPGTVREIDIAVPAEELGVTDARVAPDAEIAVTVQLESLTDGVVATGEIAAPWEDECRRCLAPLSGIARAVVDELYRLVPGDEAFPIVADQIDLAPMARELVLLGVPLAPLCRDDCAGICPHCGVELNTVTCSCAQAPVDERWSVLDDLRTQLN